MGPLFLEEQIQNGLDFDDGMGGGESYTAIIDLF
jgi:hypothetical protein